ncbi:hypothetical protein ACFYTF_05805 [Nocardia thailandica]|uniref:Uncharacterized protein n=1 Tax=Nocardia thailandica TaxID=257275 RepID=A0ABW6PIW7_9NOCA
MLDEVARCGGIRFPRTPVIVAENDAYVFHGDEIYEVVADVPEGDLDAFRTGSGLGAFGPGFPKYWAQNYWTQGAAAGLLAGGGDYASVGETTRLPARWVVVRDNGDGTRRVFVRVAC